MRPVAKQKQKQISDAGWFTAAVRVDVDKATCTQRSSCIERTSPPSANSVARHSRKFRGACLGRCVRNERSTCVHDHTARTTAVSEMPSVVGKEGTKAVVGALIRLISKLGKRKAEVTEVSGSAYSTATSYSRREPSVFQGFHRMGH